MTAMRFHTLGFRYWSQWPEMLVGHECACLPRQARLRHKLVYASESDRHLRQRIQDIHDPPILCDDAMDPIRAWPAMGRSCSTMPSMPLLRTCCPKCGMGRRFIYMDLAHRASLSVILAWEAALRTVGHESWRRPCSDYLLLTCC